MKPSTIKYDRVLYLLFSVLTIVQSATKCPPEDSVAPCACVENEPPRDISIFCFGDLITQSTLNQVFATLDSLNDTRIINHLALAGTNMTSLDLTPFFEWSFNEFYVYRNQRLTGFTGAPSTNKTDGSGRHALEGLTALDIHVDTNSLDDIGVGQLLTFIVPQDYLKKLVLRENRITGTSPYIFAYLNSFKYLTHLDLSYNFIKKIGGGQFKHLTQLQVLDLQQNHIQQVGAGAFLFERDDSVEDSDTLLVVYLDGNDLSNEQIDSQHGLDKIERDVKVYMRRNKFEFISQKNFGPFVLSMKRANILKLWGNAIVCDKRSHWLTTERKGDVSLQNFVFSVDCSNDPGQNIFTTNLVE